MEVCNYFPDHARVSSHLLEQDKKQNLKQKMVVQNIILFCQFSQHPSPFSCLLSWMDLARENLKLQPNICLLWEPVGIKLNHTCIFSSLAYGVCLGKEFFFNRSISQDLKTMSIFQKHVAWVWDRPSKLYCIIWHLFLVGFAKIRVF